MDMENHKKTIKSSLFLGAGQGIEIVGAIILMPFLISQLGLKTYGLWILINSIVGYLGVLSMGLSTAIEKDLCKLETSDHLKKYKIVFSSGLFMLIALSIVTFVVVAVGVMASDFIVDEASLQETVATILWIFGIKTMLLLPTIAFQAVISSQLRHDLFVTAEQVMVIIKVIVIVIVIEKTKSIIHLALIIAICETVSRVLIVMFAVKLKGFFLLSYCQPSTKIIKGFIRYTTPSIGIWLVERLRGSLPNFSITYYLSLEAIALYNIGFMIATYVGQFLIMSTSPLMPYFTQLLSVTDNNTKKEGSLLKPLNYTYGLIIVSISFYILGFIFSGQSFLLLLLDIVNIDAYYVGVIMSLYTLLLCSQHSFSKLFYSKGIHHQLFTLTVIEVCLIILLSIILTPAFGIVGQAISVLLPLFYTRHYLIYKRYQYDEHFNADNLKASSRIWLIPLLVLCPTAYLLSTQIQINDWLSFITANAMLIILLSSVYYLYTTRVVMKIWERNIKQLALNKGDK